MKLILALTITLISLGCQSNTKQQATKSPQSTPKTSFGQAINKAQQVEKLTNQHDQAIKEQADGL